MKLFLKGFILGSEKCIFRLKASSMGSSKLRILFEHIRLEENELDSHIEGHFITK